MKYLLTFTVTDQDGTLYQYMKYYFPSLVQPVHKGFSNLRSLRQFMKYYRGQYNDIIKWKITN